MIIAAILFSAIPVFANHSENTNEDKIKKAEFYITQYNFKKALKLYTEVIELDQANPEYYAERGLVYMTIEKFGYAKRDFQKSLSLDSQLSLASYGMSQYHMSENNLDSSLWYVNNAAAFSTDDEEINMCLAMKGKVHLERREYDMAEENLRQASMGEEVSIDLMRDLAITYYKNNKRYKAADILEETLSIFGKDLETLVNVGFISNEIGNYDDAISYFDQALVKEPGQPYALSNKAYSVMKKGDIDQALKLVNRSIENDNTNSFAYKVKGDIMVKKGEDKKACKQYRKAVEMGYVLLYDADEITKSILKTCGSL